MSTSRPATRLLLAMGGNVAGLDLTEKSGGIAVEIASRLQDLVVDETNKPWPMAVGEGRSVVLEPRLGPAGEPRSEGQ